MLSKDSVHVLELVAGIQQRPLVHIINAGQHIIKLPDNTFKDEAELPWPVFSQSQSLCPSRRKRTCQLHHEDNTGKF